MPFNLTKCDYCDCRFRVKKVLKPWIGYYKGKPTYHWHYVCPGCDNIHTVRYYNEFVNPYHDRVKRLEFSYILNGFDPEQAEQLKQEYEVAKKELDKVNKLVNKEIMIKSTVKVSQLIRDTSKMVNNFVK